MSNSKNVFSEEPLIHIPNKNENETFLHVLSFLPVKDIYKCMQICKIWNEYSNDQRLWRVNCERLAQIQVIEYQGWNDKNNRSIYHWKGYFKELKFSSWNWRRAVNLKDHYDNHFRILILGDSKTGKSSLFLRLRRKIPTQDKIKKISRFEMNYGTTTVASLDLKVTNKMQFVNNIIKFSMTVI
jgi:hypothetical protein